MTTFIGLDVHSKQSCFVAMEEAGDVVGKGMVTTSREGFLEMVGKIHVEQGTQVALETGGQMTWVSRTLADVGLRPVVINANEVRAKARRRGQKSDFRDAFELCDGLRRDLYVSVVYVPEPRVEKLRRGLSRRHHFVVIRGKEINSAKFLLRSIGVSTAGLKLDRQKAWDRLLARPDVEPVREHLRLHAEMWSLAQAQVAKLDAELKAASLSFKDVLELLMTVPGVGIVTALAFIAVIADPGRFESSGHVASYIGIVPSTHDSGEREIHGHITRSGSSMLRALLCEVAHHAALPSHPLNPYWRRMMVKHGYRKAVVAVAHRMARILYQIWKTRTPFDVEKLGVKASSPAKDGKRVYVLKCA